MITLTISLNDCFGTTVADVTEDADKFGFVIDSVETLNPEEDEFDLRFTITGEEASLAAYARYYEVEFDT